MADYSDREAFIPYRRNDLIELCVKDGKLAAEDVQKFRDFCEILSAYYHFKSQQTLEILKDAFEPFNPDSDTKTPFPPTPQQREEMEERLVHAFEAVLLRANYSRLSQEELNQAFEQESLIPLKTSVDFDDYERIVCYYRGDNFKTTHIKKLFRRVEVTFDNLERVAMLFKFKDNAHFVAKGTKTDDLNFTPGKTYIYLYKNVPRFDLELLFPNVQVSMKWLDRLFIIVPALGAEVPLALKVLPVLGIIIGIMFLVTLGDAPAIFNVSEEATENLFPTIIAALSVGMTLGGFAARQYGTYKNKRLQFLKKVTDTLFFKNLVTNQGVLYTLIDSAEEEECKEIILVYYHLLTTREALTPEELDTSIETWMERTFETSLDFDIHKTLENLQSLHAPLDKPGADSRESSDTSLLRFADDGTCQVLSLDDAKVVIDYVWDNVFQYSLSDVVDLEPVAKGS